MNFIEVVVKVITDFLVDFAYVVVTAIPDMGIVAEVGLPIFMVGSGLGVIFWLYWDDEEKKPKRTRRKKDEQKWEMMH